MMPRGLPLLSICMLTHVGLIFIWTEMLVYQGTFTAEWRQSKGLAKLYHFITSEAYLSHQSQRQSAKFF